MKQATARDIYAWIDTIAPFETALDYDNAGLLLGRMDAPVSRVLVALDATPAVIDEAVRLGAQLLLTHHPLMFRGVKHILEDEYEGGVIARIIRERLCLIAAHTNLDQSSISGSAALARKMGLLGLRADGFMVLGELPGGAQSAMDVKARIENAEDEFISLYGAGDTKITTLAIGGGAYDEGFEKAKALGAQGYLTGEVRHHNALAAVGEGMVLFCGGHFGTEGALVPELAKALQNAMNALQYNVAVYASQARPYGGRADV